MSGNPPSVWRRLSDIGTNAELERFRSILEETVKSSGCLICPEDASTTAQVTREDGQPLTATDWDFVARALIRCCDKRVTAGIVSAEQIAGIRTGALSEVIFEALYEAPKQTVVHIHERAKHHGLAMSPGPAAGVIRIVDGKIPAAHKRLTGKIEGLYLSEETRAGLDELCETWGLKKTDVIARLVSEAVERARKTR
jgi:hypothetical protein